MRKFDIDLGSVAFYFGISLFMLIASAGVIALIYSAFRFITS